MVGLLQNPHEVLPVPVSENQKDEILLGSVVQVSQGGNADGRLFLWLVVCMFFEQNKMLSSKSSI